MATIDAHGYDYFIAITILYCLCWLASLGGLANSVYVAIFIISAWGLGVARFVHMGNSYGLRVWSE